ncbi:MAG: hypothetical protein ACKOE6_10995, partial [Flammeovirgaceae bacterium]
IYSLSCGNKREVSLDKFANKDDLLGHWMINFGDSVFQGVIFNDSLRLSYDESLGLFFTKYQIEKDSMIVTNEGQIWSEFKVDLIDSTHMVLTDKFGSSKYERIVNTPFSQKEIDMILNGDEELLEKFRSDFRSRVSER